MGTPLKNQLDEPYFGVFKYAHLLLSLLAYTDPRIPFILYTDAYDIASGDLN